MQFGLSQYLESFGSGAALKARPLKYRLLDLSSGFHFYPLPLSLTYLPMFLTGHDLSTWWGMQTNVVVSHRTKGHPPIYINVVELAIFNTAGISTQVMRLEVLLPAFMQWEIRWYSGLTFIGNHRIYLCTYRKNKDWIYRIFIPHIFVPWALSPRIMFFYHYLPSVPFGNSIGIRPSPKP